MRKPPLVETPEKAISVVANESSKEFDRQSERFEKEVSKIVKGSVESLFILTVVLKEFQKLKVGKTIGFDFGNKKKWQIKRLTDFKS